MDPSSESWKEECHGNELYQDITNIIFLNKQYQNMWKEFSRKQKDQINKMIQNELFLAHSSLWQRQQIFKTILNRLMRKIQVDHYIPFIEIVDEAGIMRNPKSKILPEGNVFLKKTVHMMRKIFIDIICHLLSKMKKEIIML